MSPRVRTGQDHPDGAVRRVAWNTIYLVAAEGAGKAMLFLFFVVAARQLGAEQFGVLSFALAYVTMFTVLTDLGLGVMSTREIARDYGRAQYFVGNSLAIKSVAAALAMAGAALLVNLLGYPASTVRVVYICAAFIPTSTVALYYAYVFQGFERMQFTAVSHLLQTAVLASGVFILARGPAVVERYAMLYVGGGLAAAVLSAVLLSRHLVRPRVRYDLPAWFSLLRSALPFGLAAAFVMVYYWNGTALLSKLWGDAAVGIYSAPFRPVVGLVFVSIAFSGAVYPVMSRLFISDVERLRSLLAKCLRYMLSLAVPLGFLGTALARPVVHLLYGTGYDDSVPVMRVLVWWGMLAYINSVLSHYFYSVNRGRVVMRQAGLALGVNLLLNILLIPRFGPIGAAASILTAEAVSLGFLAGNQLRTEARLRLRQLGMELLRITGAALGASLVTLALMRWSGAAALPGSILAYCLLLVLLRGVRREDLQTLRVVFQKTNG